MRKRCRPGAISEDLLGTAVHSASSRGRKYTVPLRVTPGVGNHIQQVLFRRGRRRLDISRSVHERQSTRCGLCDSVRQNVHVPDNSVTKI